MNDFWITTKNCRGEMMVDFRNSDFVKEMLNKLYIITSGIYPDLTTQRALV